MLVKFTGLSLLSVCAILSFGIAISQSLIHLSQTPFNGLLISFSPGGIIEMALIALKQATNPTHVSIYRILITIIAMNVIWRKFSRNQTKYFAKAQSSLAI